jgi:(1->4)-alpha-D-glucan 1-alpha-D-glucosylmutase
MDLTRETRRTAILARKTIQLTCLGVADLYQGTETVQTHLVDPDNRRPNDYVALNRLLSAVDMDNARPRGLDEEKIFITHRIVRLRARRPHAFVCEAASYRPLATTTGHLVAYQRGGEVAVLATRLSATLEALGGFQEHTVAFPEGTWRDVLTDRVFEGGLVRVSDILTDYPVSVCELVEEE